MTNTLLLVSTLVLCLVIFLAGLNYFHKRKKRMEITYQSLLDTFWKLSLKKDIVGLIPVGEELVYHPCLTGKDLNKIYKRCLELETNFPEIKELRLKAYNKKLHFDRNAMTSPF